jgi:Arc/MetJ family transcription regulator
MPQSIAALRSLVSSWLTAAYDSSNIMHMRTTLILDDELLEKAKGLTGLAEKTAVVHAGLRALIAQRSAQRLVATRSSGDSKSCLR